MNGAITDLVKNIFLVVGALFPIVDPIGNTPIFLTLTDGLSQRGRVSLARMIAINGLILILTSIFIGTYILAFFGISIPVVQVGGGLVVISTGWSLLHQPSDPDKERQSRRNCDESNYARQAFYPLTLPLTVGPGSISVAIAVGANLVKPSAWRWSLVVGVVVGAVLVALSIYLSYRFAAKLGHALGESGMNVIIRLSSFILVCIGVQILWNGLSVLLKGIVR